MWGVRVPSPVGMTRSGMSPAEAASLSRLYYFAQTINTLTFGIYLVLTILSIGLMLRRRSGRRKNLSFVYSVFMLIITLGWFCANTMNNEVGVIENMIKPIDLSKSDYYCSTLNTTAEALMSAVFVGSDILLIYRLYLIYERKWLVTVVPITTWLGLIGTSIIVDLACTPAVPSFLIYARIVKAYYILPFVPNLVCTVLIIGKLVWHQRFLRHCNIKTSDRSYWLLTTCVAESGLVYSTLGIIHCVLWWHQAKLNIITQALYLASAYLCEAHIILRLALGVELVSKRQGSSTPVSPIAFDTRVYFSTMVMESESTFTV